MPVPAGCGGVAQKINGAGAFRAGDGGINFMESFYETVVFFHILPKCSEVYGLAISSLALQRLLLYHFCGAFLFYTHESHKITFSYFHQALSHGFGLRPASAGGATSL
jgi:hypothetical protein